VAGEFKPQEIADTLWAISVAKAIPAFERSLTVWCTGLRGTQWENAQSPQLHPFFLALSELDETALHRLMDTMDMDIVTAFAEECHMAFAALATEAEAIANIQRDVGTVVRDVLMVDQPGVQVWEEQVLEQEEGGYTVDMQLVGWPGRPKLAIEVDGPKRFLGGECQSGAASASLQRDLEFNSATKFKHYLLKRLGWKVLHVPFFEWSKLDGQDEKTAYVVRLLRKVSA
jgi:hypothetical protein